MKEFKISEYIIRVIVAWIGCISTISILTGCVESGTSAVGLILWTLIYTGFFVLLLFYRSSKKYIRVIIIALVIVMGLVQIPILIQGGQELVADFWSAVQFFNTSSSGGVGVTLQMSTSLQKELTILYFFVLYAGLLSIIVVYCSSMLLALIVQVPLLVALVSFNVIPSLASLILILMFVFGVAGLDRKSSGSKAAVFNIIITIVSAVICVTIYPKTRYKEMDILLQANDILMTKLDNWNNSYKTDERVVSSGGLDNGELGTVDAIEYNYEPLATIRTIDTGSTQYFPQFYGQTYSDNAWSIAVDTEDVTGNLINMIDASPDIQNALTTDQDNYYENLIKYHAKLSFRGTSQVQQYDLYLNDFAKYSFFEKLADQENLFDTQMNYDLGIMNQQTYSIYEQQYRQIVYDNYLQVPDNVRDVIGTLLGQAEVNTEEQKLSYIDYVKNYLKSNYAYSYEPGRVPNGKDFTIYFLMDNKKGYCSYFATAAVLMYRYAGIPARYVEGYVLPESRIGNSDSQETVERYTEGGETTSITYDTYTCDIDDSCAHAWVEVYMDGYGWVTEEVTPASSTGDITNAQSLQDGDYNGASALESTTEAAETDEKESGSGNQTTTEAQSSSKSSTDTGKESNTTNAAQEDVDNKAEDSSNASDGLTSTDDAGMAEGLTADTGEAQNTKGKLFSLYNQNGELRIGLLIVLLLVVGIILRWIVIKLKRKRIYYGKPHTTRQILAMYHNLEQMLKYTEYARKEEQDYEKYAKMLCSKSICFRQNYMQQIVAIIMRLRFDKEKQSTVEEYRMVRNNLLQIRAKVLRSQKWWRRFVITVIYGK